MIHIEIGKSFAGLRVRIGDLEGSIEESNTDKKNILKLIGDEIDRLEGLDRSALAEKSDDESHKSLPSNDYHKKEHPEYVRLYTKQWRIIDGEGVCPWVCDKCNVIWYEEWYEDEALSDKTFTEGQIKDAFKDALQDSYERNQFNQAYFWDKLKKGGKHA